MNWRPHETAPRPTPYLRPELQIIERYRFDPCSAAMTLHFSEDPVRTGATAAEHR
jgi:hypothetical protein